MAQEKLVDLMVGNGLEQGLYPSADPTSGQIWFEGQSVWFRDLTIEQQPGRQKILNIVGATAQALTQAYNAPTKSLYYENAGSIYQMNGTGNPTVFTAPAVIGAVVPGSQPWLEPWGTWLIITDGIKQPQLWQPGTGVIKIGMEQFKTAQIIRKLAQFAIAYNLDIGENAFAWSNLDDITNWAPPTPPEYIGEAANLTIRNLDSGIVAVQDLAGAHGVYSQNTLVIVQFVGFQNGWFGTPNQAIVGVGAVSKYSVVAVGQINFGITRTGIFSTDGTNASWLDRPAIDKFVREDIDWTRADEVAGYWNGKLQLVIWSVPLLPSSSYYDPIYRRMSIALDPQARTVTPQSIYLQRKTFTFLDKAMTSGMEQEVFDYPIIVQADGLYYESVPDTLYGGFSLTTHLFDGQDTSIFKLWDYAIVKGTFDPADPTMQMRFGHTDEPTLDSIVWDEWQPLALLNPPFAGPRESIFLALGFKGASLFKMTAITIYGEKGGLVN